MQRSNEFDPSDRVDVTARAIVDAAVAVHRELGPGLLESAYESCLCLELRTRDVAFERQRTARLMYRGGQVGWFRIDLVVASLVVVEIKSIARATPLHRAQLMTYLRLTDLPLGLLLNFNVPIMRNGITRIAN